MRTIYATLLVLSLAGAAVAQTGAPSTGTLDEGNTYTYYLQGPQGPKGEVGARGPQGKPGKRIVVYRENKRCVYELRSVGPRAMQWVCISAADAKAGKALAEAEKANRRIDEYDAWFSLGNMKDGEKAAIIGCLILLLAFLIFAVTAPARR